MKIHVEGTDLWYDLNEAIKQREFYKQKEQELWEWIFSGQRTIDMFGVDGAKWVLERQARRDRRLGFNHKSRGRR